MEPNVVWLQNNGAQRLQENKKQTFAGFFRGHTKKGFQSMIFVGENL